MATTPQAAKAAPAGRRRFWVAVLCFAFANLVFNLGAWVAWDHLAQSRRRPLLEVRQFHPGDGAAITGRETFTWTFNLDVAPPAASAPAPGRIAPDAPGKWKWADARTLAFT